MFNEVINQLSFFDSIVDHAYKTGNQGNNGMEILINEWGTMGKQRPTINDMLRICLEMEALVAASYINDDILHSTSLIVYNTSLITIHP